MTPEEFVKAVKKAKKDSIWYDGKKRSYDWESFHGRTDELMEEILTDLGYEAGIKEIHKGRRWYA